MPAASPVSAGKGVGCAGNTYSGPAQHPDLAQGRRGYERHVPLPVAPPPCLWEPIGGTAAGSTSIISQFGSAAPGTPFGVYQSVRQARALLRDKPVPPGTWWQLPVNPAASKAAQRQCDTLPLFFFTVPGQAPPTPPVPLGTLADYAYNHGDPRPHADREPGRPRLRQPGHLRLGPDLPVSATTGRPGAYEVTATLGGESVSVWAQLAAKGAFSVGANGPGTPYSACGPAGSPARVGHAPASAGAGAPPLRRALAGPGGRGVRQRHRDLDGQLGCGRAGRPGPNTLPPIQLTGRTPPFPVAEIQSINGG